MKKIINLVLLIYLNCNLFAKTKLHEGYKPLDKILPPKIFSFLSESSAAKLKELIETYGYTTGLELGSGLGASTIYMALQLPNNGKLYAIDSWFSNDNLYVRNGIIDQSTFYNQFLSNVIFRHVHRKIIPINKKQFEAVQQLKSVFDFIYLTYSNDTEQLLELLSVLYSKLKEKGTICGENWHNSIVKKNLENFASNNKLKINNIDNFWWFEPKPKIENNAINNVLRNKIILCTGPSFGRKKQLIETTEKDMALIPFKKIFLATQDPNNLNVVFNKQEPYCVNFQQRGKQLDCLNCIINSIRVAINDPECEDSDIIIFKHESVYINDMNLLSKAVKKLVEGYDIVVRHYQGYPELASLMERSGIINDYYGTNVFLIKVSAARKVFSNLQELCEFSEEYHFCEEFFTKKIVNKLQKVYSIDYFHSSWKDNELGFYHIPRYEEDYRWYWDKENYDELYDQCNIC